MKTILALLLLLGSLTAQAKQPSPYFAICTHSVEAGKLAGWVYIAGPHAFFLVEARSAKTGQLLLRKFGVATARRGGMRAVLIVRMPEGGIIWTAMNPGLEPHTWVTKEKIRWGSRSSSVPIPYKVPFLVSR